MFYNIRLEQQPGRHCNEFTVFYDWSPSIPFGYPGGHFTIPFFKKKHFPDWIRLVLEQSPQMLPPFSRDQKHLLASLDRGLICVYARGPGVMSVEVHSARENCEEKAHLQSCRCLSTQVLARDDDGMGEDFCRLGFLSKILDVLRPRHVTTAVHAAGCIGRGSSSPGYVCQLHLRRPGYRSLRTCCC
jgi:hypothetical protein